RPAESPQTFYKSLGELLELIRANGATPVLYETWGRAEGSETLTSRGWTHEIMQEKLYAAYKHAAEEYGTLLAPAGERFHEAYTAGEPVFAEDGSHPSPLGSRIAAEAICEAIFGAGS
ncbi:MAG: SGNH/GDSL hydrolase family protein, partial [Clostridia bacterium]|nr:SGNH/GDSL hydrolase family protein [Clostridia bacterium]